MAGRRPTPPDLPSHAIVRGCVGVRAIAEGRTPHAEGWSTDTLSCPQSAESGVYKGSLMRCAGQKGAPGPSEGLAHLRAIKCGWPKEASTPVAELPRVCTASARLGFRKDRYLDI